MIYLVCYDISHPKRLRRTAKILEDFGLRAPDEVWVVTTEGKKTVESLESLAKWWGLLGDVRPLRVWQAAGTNELTGSAILGHAEAIAQYAREVYEYVKRERLLYCELRGSPLKYLGGDGLQFLRLFSRALKQLELVAREEEDNSWLPRITFVIITNVVMLKKDLIS